MQTGNEDLIRAITGVYLMEKGINQFYAQLSVKAKSPETRRTFTALANWEAEHVQYIQNFYQTLTDEKSPTYFHEFAGKARPDTAEGGIPLTELEKKMDEFVFLDDLGALQFALKVEADEYELYRRVAEKTGDTNIRALCEEFMGWEQDHIRYLKRQLESRGGASERA
ncbi:MAG: hypothetical protein OHK006_15700 [Thermodesulfovibrionales bacterium]